MSPRAPILRAAAVTLARVAATGLAYLVLSVGLVPLFVVVASAGAAAAASARAGSWTHLNAKQELSGDRHLG